MENCFFNKRPQQNKQKFRIQDFRKRQNENQRNLYYLPDRGDRLDPSPFQTRFHPCLDLIHFGLSGILNRKEIKIHPRNLQPIPRPGSLLAELDGGVFSFTSIRRFVFIRFVCLSTRFHCFPPNYDRDVINSRVSFLFSLPSSII